MAPENLNAGMPYGQNNTCKEKMSLEEAHHHRRPWIRAWRKEMNEGRGREEHEILFSKRALKCEV